MGMLSTAGRKLRSASALTVYELSLVFPVFCLLGLARLAIICAPFNRYARHFGGRVQPDVPPIQMSAQDMQRAVKIGRVVRRTARVTPWKSLCLAQAMVAAFLMRCANLPYQVFFGLALAVDPKSTDLLAAHAWLRAGDINLTGGKGVHIYTVVQVFEHSVRAAR